MAKKTSKKYLSDYEEDLIWMSYRYCIGRHTIAAGMHAGNIVKNAYEKLNPERQEFMAFDIRREIESVLRWSKPSFYLGTVFQRQDLPEYRPLELFIEAINNKTLEEVKTIGNIHLDSIGGDYVFDYKGQGETNNFSLTDLHDLMTWMDVASCFDTKSHKTCKCLNPDTGETQEVEYFESYVLSDFRNVKFTKIKVPVAEYVKNPFITTRINEECICG